MSNNLYDPLANQIQEAAAVTATEIALADGKVLIGGSAGVAVAQTPTGDVTISRSGVTAIGADKITGAMLKSGAGVAAILAAGLGGSGSIVKTDAKTLTLAAAHPTKARACLVVVTIDQTYAIGTGTLPTIKVGEEDTTDKCFAATLITDKTAGTVLVFAFTNTATKAIVATATAAVGNATGGCSIAVLAIPTT